LGRSASSNGRGMNQVAHNSATMTLAPAAPPGAARPVAEGPRLASRGLVATIRSRKGAFKCAIGLVMVSMVVLVAVASPWLAPYDPNQQALAARLRPPVVFGGDSSHLLGTDNLGRDMLSRLMAGGRISLLIATLTVLASTALGTLLGLYAGYHGRRVDSILTMAAEIQLSLPSILIIMLFLALIGPSIVTVALVLALSDWVVYARTIRGKAMVEKTRDYVTAARALGASDSRLVFRHLWPNVLPTLMVLATVSLGHVVLTESALSYLGLGVQRPSPSWGRMVADGQQYLSNGWWISTIPALTIGFVVLGVNLLGDGLRQLWKME
jgi:peptide/nickel transport system permease protein